MNKQKFLAVFIISSVVLMSQAMFDFPYQGKGWGSHLKSKHEDRKSEENKISEAELDATSTDQDLVKRYGYLIARAMQSATGLGNIIRFCINKCCYRVTEKDLKTANKDE